MNINEAFPSKYLKASDLGDKRPTVIMESVSMETLGQGEEQETKPVVSFRGKDKGLVLNKTNSNTIAGLYGPDTDKWAGQPITLSAVEVAYKGKMCISIRVSTIKPKGGAAADPHPKTENQNEPADIDMGHDEEIPF